MRPLAKAILGKISELPGRHFRTAYTLRARTFRNLSGRSSIRAGRLISFGPGRFGGRGAFKGRGRGWRRFLEGRTSAAALGMPRKMIRSISKLRHYATGTLSSGFLARQPYRNAWMFSKTGRAVRRAMQALPGMKES